MNKIKVDNTLEMVLIDNQHAETLYQLVKLNRQHLREWLPWVDHMRSVEDFRKYINSSKQRYANHTEMGYVIMAGQVMVGRVGMYNIDLTNKSASIGYWLDKEWMGKGIITRCCKAIIEEGFSYLLLNRIEIRAATANSKSQAIPERLGFKREGIIRQGEFVNNQFVDLYVYSMLKEEWQKSALTDI
ncbi:MULTISPECIES: GNAT family N-acetyltransferase [Niastella]|uniref:GNAT family N-acetyltransferase n=1 Tax=Niastella soli TaxID=2821487 RepID=A0ABS3YUJ7_9BACT|nr:GNAT family protein [Niastella soli]MBO9201543.1 GNAT family N-acetyltransferase [Niastella soli]